MSRRRRTSRGRGRSRKPVRPGLLVRLAGAVAVGVTGFALGIGFARHEGGEVTQARNVEPWTGSRVRVEVLNGGGVAGMARSATEHLRDAGFDVVDFGNADTFDEGRPSSVVDRSGRIDAARAVAETLGIDSVHSEPDPNLYVDVTVVLGRGWSPESATSAEDEPRGRPAWDPRRWLGS